MTSVVSWKCCLRMTWFCAIPIEIGRKQNYSLENNGLIDSRETTERTNTKNNVEKDTDRMKYLERQKDSLER